MLGNNRCSPAGQTDWALTDSAANFKSQKALQLFSLINSSFALWKSLWAWRRRVPTKSKSQRRFTVNYQYSGNNWPINRLVDWEKMLPAALKMAELQLLLLCGISDCKWRVWGFWTVGRTKARRRRLVDTIVYFINPFIWNENKRLLPACFLWSIYWLFQVCVHDKNDRKCQHTAAMVTSRSMKSIGVRVDNERFVDRGYDTVCSI